ncbi:MAG: sucrase ferredoxin [Myxococcota bacterium]
MAQLACADAALAIGEPLLGSAGSATALVAISWPKPLWHDDNAALSQGLPPDIAALQERSEASGHKIDVRVFQRAPGLPRDPAELICVSAGGRRSLHQSEVPVGEIAARAARFLAGQEVGPELRTPCILVCTDGKHDRCCATFGRTMYQVLVDQAAGRASRIEVAECSHLGGHRFAANCLVVPDARVYGRLRPEDAAPLIDAVESGGVHLPRYRGRFGLTEPRQIAEAQVLLHHPDARALEVGDPDLCGGEARVPVRFESDGESRSITVLCRADSYTGVTSCGPDAEPETRDRWICSLVDWDRRARR